MSRISKHSKLSVQISLTALLSSLLFLQAFSHSTTLPTLHVQAHKLHDNHKSSMQASVDLNAQAIAQSGSISAVDLINKQGIAHIQAGSGNPNQNSVSMDGFGDNASTNTLLLLDGIPISSFTNVGPNLNNVLISNIQNLSILPGSYGVLYGNQAVSGVVKIKSRIPSKPIFTGNFGMGNMGQIMTGAYLSKRPVPKWGYNVGIQSDYNHHDGEYRAQQNTTFNFNLHHFGSDNLTTANVISYVNTAQVPVESVMQGSTTGFFPPLYYEMSGNIFYLTNKHLFTANKTLQSRLAIYQTEMQMNTLKNNVWVPGADIKEQGLFFSNQYQANHYFLGLDDRANTYKMLNMGSESLAEGNILSPYVRTHIHWNKKLSSVLGVRYAYQYLNAKPVYKINENNQAWANEESLAYQFNSTWQASLRHDSSYAFANGKDVLWRLGVNPPALNTQTGDEYSVNVHFHNHADDSLLSIYQMDIQNELALRFTDGMSEMYNLPPTQRRGVNFTNNWAFTRSFSLQTQLAYVNPRLTKAPYKNNLIPGVSLWNGSIGLTYQTHNHWLASIQETGHSAYYAAFDLGNQGKQLPGYVLTNLLIQKQSKMITYDLSINNLFNKKYVQFANYSASHGVEYYPADGISVLFHMTFNFLAN